MSAGHFPHTLEKLDGAVNEVRYYEKRKHSIAVKAAECFPRDWIVSSATELLCNVGQVIKTAIQGVTKNPASTVSYLQQRPTAEVWRIGKAEQIENDYSFDTAS